MKKIQREDHPVSTHQTVTSIVKLNTGRKTIKIETTDQKLSAHAGQAMFWGFVHLRKLRSVLDSVMPYQPSSPNALRPVEIALSFIGGILAGANKLTRIAQLRQDQSVFGPLRGCGAELACLPATVALVHDALAQSEGWLQPGPRLH